MTINDYYVYIYYRLDTNEPFYIGKGHGVRWKDFGRRNEHFMNIVNTIPTIVVIEKDNLTENEAFYWEEEIIRRLVFEYGFSIEIKGCNSDNHYCHLTNQTWGGEGLSRPLSDEHKQLLRNLRTGSKLSKETRKKMSKTQKEVQNRPEIKKRKSEASSGENNPMYGKNPYDYMSEETKENLRKIKSENSSGKKNPMYGKSHSEKTKRKISNTRKEKEIGKGKNNPNARKVICVTTGEIFDCMADASKHYDIKYSSYISACCRGEKKYAGKLPDGTLLVWMYLDVYRKEGGAK